MKYFMYDYQSLIHKIDSSDEETFWFGAASKDQIRKLEILLQLSFPNDFSAFLEVCGGGGVVESEICGIEKNDATLARGGTVNYSTSYCRTDYDLPMELAVIFLKDDEICWAIDCSLQGKGKVVSYNIFSKKTEQVLAENFYDFFRDYIEIRV
ncbi:SMI1/KNR4 family protein [Pseudomonas chlororaphis]|uniref:SMI1/KNR4 family protein n=1 Tax=Pseudomonas chlororaphis TaxID=587753 RepID=UPI001B30A9E0|nr:SMI1/KNR4 family protein [Pseudomonas chlororaphis]